MAELTPNTRRRDWLFGRVDVHEILAAQKAAIAMPPTKPYLGLDPSLQHRRTSKLPLPPDRIRPPDLEATLVGTRLYGARPGRQGRLLVARQVLTDTVGDRLTYTTPEDAWPRIVLAHHRPESGAPTVQLILRRVGVDMVLLEGAGGQTWRDEFYLEPGDRLVWAVSTAAAAGSTSSFVISAEEWR